MSDRIALIPVLLFIACITSITLLFPCMLPAQEAFLPFYPDGSYDPAIPTPRDVIGINIGERPVRYDEARRYFLTLAEKSPLVRFFEAGETHEGRKLFYIVITSPENIERLDDVRLDIGRLADPRKLDSDESAAGIAASSPAVVWMMHSIHGNELSGTDSSMQLAYQLAAGTDRKTIEIREKLVIGIDPMENPDGRERSLAQVGQWMGRVPSPDGQSIQHTGIWPNARTNHYLFDLNRDWFILANPESRSRVKTLLHWNPQVIVDAHEMGQYSSYLFNPPREPINMYIHPVIRRWWQVFAKDQAAAFDRHGWSYYTKEWLDNWYPGYTTSWADCIGAVAILYEQAYTAGSPVKRPDGTTLTFRDAVLHQFTSSMANLTTAAEHREELLTSYYGIKKEALSPDKKKSVKAYYIDPGDNPSRARRLVERLISQGIEVGMTDEDYAFKNFHSYWNREPVSGMLPRGSYVISLAQPLRPLIDAILEFDPRMTTDFLNKERVELEKGRGSLMYETSAWSMFLTFNVRAYSSDRLPDVVSTSVTSASSLSGNVTNPSPDYGYLIDYRDDSAIDALLAIYNRGLKVRSANKPFRIGNRDYPRGTLLLRTIENASGLGDVVAEITRETGADVQGVDTALSQSGPDLGGEEFRLLAEPRIAILTGSSIDSYSFGSTWYLLDYDLELRHSILYANYFTNADLRPYNVLILPSGGIQSYRNILGTAGLKKIKDWVSQGGTLITLGGASAYMADSTTAFSSVKLRRQILNDLDKYRKALTVESSRGTTIVDSLSLWEGTPLPTAHLNNETTKEATSKSTPEELEELDSRMRIFLPRGALLRVDLDTEHWLAFGAGEKVPVNAYTSYSLMSKLPTETIGRYGDAETLRISGLLWPEARERWRDSAWLTRERHGRGQIILFAGEPNYRAYFYGSSRLLINAMLLGPGLGARQPVHW